MIKIVILGKKNVGKSSLFNLLSGSDDAVTIDYEGYTRDCKRIITKLSGELYEIIDTPGLGYVDDRLSFDSIKVVWDQVKKANLVLLLLTIDNLYDKSFINILNILKRTRLNVIYVLNKIDKLLDVDINNFLMTINAKTMLAISVKNKLYINKLIKMISEYNSDKSSISVSFKNLFRLTIVGRENVGKSLFVNKLLGYPSSFVDDYPGVTRDLLDTILVKNNKRYLVVDTPGIKRNIRHNISKLPNEKTINAIKLSNMCLIIIDVSDILNKQDLFIIKNAIKLCRTNILVFNKSDLKTKKDLIDIEMNIKDKFKSLKFYKYHFISAKYSLGLESLFYKIDNIKNIQNVLSFKTILDNIKYKINSRELFLKKNIKIKKIQLLDTSIFSVCIYLNYKNAPQNLKKLLCTMIIKYLDLKSFSFKFCFK